MKTNIIILLALSTSAHLVSAAKPAVNVANKKLAPKNLGVHPAIPSSVRTVVSAPVNRSANPPRPSGSGVQPQPAPQGSGTTLKPGIKFSTGTSLKQPGASIGGSRLNHTTDPRLGNFNQGVMGQGFQAARDMKQFGDLRGLVPGFEGGFGPQGNRPVGPGAPDLSLGGGGFSGRDIRNPLDRSSNAGSGLTDIGSVQANSRKGSETSRSHLSSRGDRLLGAFAPSGSSTRYGSTSSQTGESENVGYASNGRSSTTVTEQRDTRGRLSGTTLETGHAGSRSTDYKTVHFDGHGRAQDVVVNRENNRTGEQTKEVYGPDGNRQSSTSSRDVPTPRETNPGEGDGSKKGCGTGPSDGASLGGPIGPRVQEVSGLTSIDLLRQFAESQPTGGGTNYMTSRRVTGNTGCGNSNENTGVNSNRLKTNLFGTISNPGPLGGEGATGGGNGLPE